jgi:hypothetical protein
MPRVFIDGSSTAYGLWGGREGGWGDRVKRAHMPDNPDPDGKRPLWKVYNLATPHRDIADIMAQLPEFIKNYSRGDRAVVTVIMVGQVESRYSDGSLETDMPLEKFKETLRKMASLAIKETQSLVLVGTTPVVEEKVRSVGRLACRYDMEQRLAYDDAISEAATESGAPYVHVMSTLRAAQEAGEEVMDVDGLHPNGFGHTLLYNLIHPIVEREAMRLQFGSEW